MDDLRELYQTTILDHNKSPRNFGRLASANREAAGHNPLCGDKLTLYLELDADEVVRDVAFEGNGCAISTASASLLTEYAKGKQRSELENSFERFHELCTANASDDVDTDGLGKLAVFAGVREFPMRVKCATLGWHTLRAALHGDDATVTTE